jgi:hypothetical protein
MPGQVNYEDLRNGGFLSGRRFDHAKAPIMRPAIRVLPIVRSRPVVHIAFSAKSYASSVPILASRRILSTNFTFRPQITLACLLSPLLCAAQLLLIIRFRLVPGLSQDMPGMSRSLAAFSHANQWCSVVT